MYKVELSLHEMYQVIGALEYSIDDWYAGVPKKQEELKKLVEKLNKKLD